MGIHEYQNAQHQPALSREWAFCPQNETPSYTADSVEIEERVVEIKFGRIRVADHTNHQLTRPQEVSHGTGVEPVFHLLLWQP